MDDLLIVDHLSQYFKLEKGILKAVDDVSFSVKKGEVLGIVGESGCGKTTLGRTIIKLYKATKGNIYFDGENITNTKKFNTNISMIFQDPIASLNPRMKIKDIIAEGLIIRGPKKEDKKIRCFIKRKLKKKNFRLDIERQVYEVLELVGLSREHANRYPHEFSGGQRQRIGIARALITRPKLIIADEIVSALDVSIQAQIINILNDLKEKFSLTIIFIAHDLSVVKYFADRIIVMNNGKIYEQASSEELFSNPLHPYTKALLSAIFLPDPQKERKRERLIYEENSKEGELSEIGKNHYVYKNF